VSQNLIQPSFAAGELSPSLWARVDLAKYHVGASLMRNFFVYFSGGAFNRAGTEYVGRCFSGINRLISFTFSTVQSYALLFSDLKMRVIMDGGFVLETAQAITGITKANPGVLTYTGTDPANGDWMYLTGIGGMTELNGRTVIVANVNAGANTFELTDLDGVNINTTSYGTFTAGGTMARVYTIASPYAASDLSLLKFTQSADTMTFTHVSYAPRQLTRTAHASWAFTTITFAPAQAAPTNLTVTSSSAGTTTYRYVATAVNANGSESRGSTSGSNTASATMSLVSGSFETIGITAATGAVYYNFYQQQEVAGSAASVGSLYGFVGQSTSAGTAAFVANNISPDFTQTPPQANNPFSSGANYNPGCVTYYDGRQIFAGSNTFPQTLWASKSGDFLNMDFSIPARADDAITVTLNSAQVNAIQHLVPMQSLIAMTIGGAWKIDGGKNSDSITAVGDFSAEQQVYNGCHDQVPPIVCNNELLYVQLKGSIVRNLSYNLYANVFTGVDLTPLSSHLFFGHQITEWAYSEEPFKVVWCVRDDGIMLSLTFLKEQEIYGWAHSDTQGLFKSICSVSEPPEDAIYTVVERTIPGVNSSSPVKYVERMHSRNFLLAGDPDVSLAWFVDSGLQYPPVYLDAQATPSGSTGAIIIEASSSVFTAGMVGNTIRINGGIATVTAYNSGTIVAATVNTDLEEDDYGNQITAQSGDWTCTAPVDTVTGLWHLEGATVAILAGGGVVAEQEVVNGSITIDHAQDIITVGLPYTAQLRSLYLDPQGAPTVQGKRKKIAAVTVRVDASRGLKVASGPNFTNMVEIKERTNENMGQPTRLITGDERVVIQPKYEETGQICLEQSFPLPASVLGLVPEYTIGDS
tara:strand:- start:6318 stop:8915 length:2598 start_codon:yes stop_codon:yes gene_type:complete